jgi:hypothetical protein
MNLIQIQEHLKDLPTQAIMGYANGQNPEVPPYMALGEMNRRKAMEQRAAQAPDTSVKEKLESELSQQIALPGVGQGMNMRINPAGMPQPMPAAQPQMAPRMPAMPIQPAARPMPPQQMAQPGVPPGGMAAGGLAELPVRKDIFNYAPGGIVAFADESNEQLVLPPGTPADPNETGRYSEPQTSDKLPVDLANQILRKRLMGQVDLPEPVDRDQVKAELLAKKPELAGLIDKLPGEALTKLAATLEQQNAAQRDRFQQGEGARGLASLSNALIAAGEATRGQKGMGGIGAAFGGFGKTYNAATAEAEDRAAKQQALERAQTIETMKLQSDIEQMQRAFAEGRVDDAMKYKAAIEARKAKLVEIQGAGAKETLDLEDKRQQRVIQEAQRVAQEARYKAQEAHEGRMEKKSDYANSLAAASKPTAEERKVTLALTRVNGDRVIQALAQAAKEPGLPQDEYDSILRKIEARERAIFANQGVKDVPVGVESTIQTATNAKGEVITSTDGGTTWKDAKGKIVK